MELARKRNNMPSNFFSPVAKTRAEVCLGWRQLFCQSTFFLGVDINLSVAPRNPIYFSQSAVSSSKLCYLSLALTQWHKIAAFCASSGLVTQSHFNNPFNEHSPGLGGQLGSVSRGHSPSLSPAMVFPCPISAAQVPAGPLQHHSAVSGTQERGPEPHGLL